MAKSGIKRVGRGFELGKTKSNYNRFKQTAPKLIAENTKNHFLEGFRTSGGQTDDSKGGWAARKPKSKRNGSRGILIDTGALRRSIKVLNATWSKIIIGTQRIPYAERHNEGLNMPQREFIGKSSVLDTKNKKILVNLLRKVFR